MKLCPTRIRVFFMKKSLNWNKILKLILPSVFFIVCIALYVGAVRGWIINSIAVSIALLLLGNIFLQNTIISQIFGVIFSLGSLFMTAALFSDVFNGKATLSGGYWVGLVLVLFSAAMSILLILGYEKPKAIE